jgi:hypothetical protein
MNTQIADFVFTATGRADAFKAEAARLRAEPATGWADYDRNTKVKAAANDKLAANWTARADEAKRGFVLVDTTDVPFQVEFTSLISGAAKASRAKFISPDADPLPASQPQELPLQNIANPVQ